MQKPRILVYTSSATRIPTREGPHDCGTWLSEITEPLEPLYDAGATFDFATPDGRPCHLDPNSLKLVLWGLSKKKLEHALGVIDALKALGLDQPTPLAHILADTPRLATYDLLFVPGGHAPMTDVLYHNWHTSEELNADTGELLRYFHDHGKLTALICHGPAVLGAAPYVNGKWLYAGYEMTCVSQTAEWLTEDLPFLGNKHHLLEYPAHILTRHGGNVKHVKFGHTLVIEDRELITAQDPLSGDKLGEHLHARLCALNPPSPLA